MPKIHDNNVCLGVTHYSLKDSLIAEYEVQSLFNGPLAGGGLWVGHEPQPIKFKNCPKFVQVQSLSRVCQMGHMLQLMKSILRPVFVQKQCDQVLDKKIGESNICLEIDSEF